MASVSTNSTLQVIQTQNWGANVAGNVQSLQVLVDAHVLRRFRRHAQGIPVSIHDAQEEGDDKLGVPQNMARLQEVFLLVSH